MDDFKLSAQVRSQPTEIERLLTDEHAQDAAVAAAKVFAAAGRVDVVGIGTSHNAALTAAYLLRAAGIDAVAWSSYDYTLYGAGTGAAGGKPLLLLSHTGGKQFSRRAFQGPEGGTPPTSVVVVSGEEGEGDGGLKGVWEPELEHRKGTVVFRTCSQETSSMYTVSHLTAMTAVAMMAEVISPGCLGGAESLSALPEAATAALNLEAKVAALAREWHSNSAAGGEIVAIGAGPHEASAHEVEIKIGEAARVRCKGYAVEQYLHGRQIQIQKTDAFLVFGGPGKALERTQAAARFLAAVQNQCGGTVTPGVVWVGPEGSCPEILGAGITHLKVPKVHEQLAVIIEAIPGQLLAGHLAALAGVNGDSFRMDGETDDSKKFLNAHIKYISKL